MWNSFRPLKTFAALLAGCGLLLVGCRPADQITSYRAPKPESIAQLTPVSAANATPGAPKQTLGAIAIVKNEGWFFKITGSPERVAKQKDAFQEYLKSLEFAAQGPQWKLPSGWSQAAAGGGIRFATLLLDSESPPLELSVTRLDKVEGSSDSEYLLQNINRWRNQLQLPPHPSAREMRDECTTLEAGGQSLTVVDISGTEGQSGMGLGPLAGGAKGPLPPDHPPIATPGPSKAPGTPPFAGPGAGGPAPAALPAGQSPAKEAGFAFKLPAGWSEVAPGSPFTTAKFIAEKDGRRVEISLSSAGGDLTANINRWRGQVGLAPVDEAGLAETLTAVDLGGVPAKRVDLIGESKAILGVVAPRGGGNWFVKLTGDADLAQSEQARFGEFLKSLQLPK